MIRKRKYPKIDPIPGAEIPDKEEKLKKIFDKPLVERNPAKSYKLTIQTNKGGPYSVSGNLASVLFAYSLVKLFVEAGGELTSTSCKPIGPGMVYSIKDLDYMVSSNQPRIV